VRSSCPNKASLPRGIPELITPLIPQALRVIHREERRGEDGVFSDVVLEHDLVPFDVCAWRGHAVVPWPEFIRGSRDVADAQWTLRAGPVSSEKDPLFL
jgi:hypothetical protein